MNRNHHGFRSFFKSCICLQAFFFCFVLSSNAQSSSPLSANAGPDKAVCPGNSTIIGGIPSASGGRPPYTYNWMPVTGLSTPSSANPTAAPAIPITYTLTVSDSAGSVAIDSVRVSILTFPAVSAGTDLTILQGTNIALQASGAVHYYWTPTDPLTNQNSASPIAEPSTSTTFCVVGADGSGCINSDCMNLTVIPSDTLVIYNAFSPNGDGYNDLFFIGNIEQYPENVIEIYNRNGKMVYQKSPYNNDWNGRIEGADLPAATYYFILKPGKGKSDIHGAVTIIR